MMEILYFCISNLTKTSMKRVLFTSVSLLLATAVLAAQAPDYPTGGAPATAAAVSPTDGSLWVGTAGDGLRRTGRNGKVLLYDASRSGQPIDSVASLRFDPDGTLHLENSRGAWFTYTSLSGFVREDAPEAEPVIEQTAAPDPVVVVKKRSPLPWMLLGLAVGALGMFLILRKKQEEPAPVPEPVPVPVPEPAPVPSPKPIVEEKPKVKIQVNRQPQNEKSNVESPGPARVKEESLVLTPPEDGSFSEQVEKLIRENLSDPELNVETIAARLGISRIHVNRKMQKETGTSPSALITRLRMEKAAELLTGEKRPVAEVAGAVGFVTASYFSSAFRKYFGMTPKEFVKKNS